MIELAPGLHICPSHVVAVKSVDEGKCSVFTVGQRAEDGGFLVDRDADEVVKEIEDALED
jgi:hypothetical protein